MSLLLSQKSVYSKDGIISIGSLRIQDRDGKILITNDGNNIPKIQEMDKKSHGLLGIARIKNNSYLISITSVEFVLNLLGKYPIWRVKKSELIPLSNNSILDDESEESLSLLNGFLSTCKDILFSIKYDLTLSLQSQHTQASLRPCERFLMNKKMLKEVPPAFIGNDNSFIIAIEGVALQDQLQHPGTPDHRSWLTLLCRRGIDRVGTRFHSRGIDSDGKTSNFVESEQIFQHFKDGKEHLYAHIQIRGSIPIFWNQNINIRYRPPLEIHSKGQKTHDAILKHFTSLKDDYSDDIVVINLINKSGWEAELAKNFEEEMKSIPFCHYKHFEFAKECPNMNYHNISKLMIYLDSFLKKESFFHKIVDSNEIISLQKGVIRMNCIDCLDRTNLTQSWIARKVLYQQMREENRDSSKHTFLLKEDDYIFRNIWSTHGDIISKQYSGTGALKSDFTRTGKRSLLGLYNDGMNSIHRYFLNNFYDAIKQDQYDIFYREGNNDSIPQWWLYGKSSSISILLFVPFLVIFSLYLFMRRFKNATSTIILSSILVLVIFYKWIIRQGSFLVRFPRLFPSTEAVRVWKEMVIIGDKKNK